MPKEYCRATYLDTFQTLLTGGANETDAQRTAIRDALLAATAKYPDVPHAQLWKYLHEAHIARKSGADIAAESIPAVISAHQSWVKTGGHAFEEAIMGLMNPRLAAHGIELVLQKTVSDHIRKKSLANSAEDIAWIRGQQSRFDLFALVEDNGKRYVFGCIQAKTSIRERVTGDRAHSLNAMQRNFWSIAIVLDGDFLAMPTFIGMVNGNTPSYAGFGWHGCYVLSNAIGGGRIFLLDAEMKPFVEHAQHASHQYLTDRIGLRVEWDCCKKPLSDGLASD